MTLLPVDNSTPAPSPADPEWWGHILAFLAESGFKALQVAMIIVGAVIITWLLRLVIRRLVKRIVNGAKTKANVDDTQAIDRSPLSTVRLVQRTRTLGTILQNVVNVIVVLVAVVLIVQVVNDRILSSLTLLTAAIGAGLGFGAQNIVKDVLNGIFIVAEDQIGIGDVVDLELATGVVEYVSVRVTHVRDANGTLWYVRNGEITRIGNLSQGWARVIIDLSVPLDAEIPDVEETMLAAANTIADDPKWRSLIIERPEIWGLESVTGEGLVIRLVMKTRANAKEDVGRELRVRLKKAMDEAGIRHPQLTSVMLSGLENAGQVRGVNPPKTKPNPVATEIPERPVWNPKRWLKRPTTEGGAADREADGGDAGAQESGRDESS